MKKISAKRSEKKVNQAPKKQTASSTSPHDGNLVLAQDLFRQGNLPQAEIYTRRCLASDGNNSAAAELLDDLRRAYGFPASFELVERSNRYLLIKAWGQGFWSDVLNVVNNLLLAELTQRVPIILWGSNSLYRRDSDINAFGHYFQAISSARIEDIPQPATIFPPKWNWENLYEENVNKWEGKCSRMAEQYFFNRSETLLVSDFAFELNSIIPWIGRGSKYYGLSHIELRSELLKKYMKPTPHIAAKVDDFYRRRMHGRPWVGVHIRGSDKIHEYPNLAITQGKYFAYVDRIVELNPTIGVFLLTDSSMLKGEFIKRYGERLLFTEATRTDGNVGLHNSRAFDGVVIGEEVLVDSLLALKCDYFVGYLDSNVSLAIMEMGNWPEGFIFLLGEDNRYRGDNLFLHNNHPRPQNEFA